MAIDEKKRKSNDRYNAKCDFIAIKPVKERGERIRAAAAASGQSLQGYILQAVEERMEREKPEPDELEAIAEAKADTSPTVPHEAINCS
jgi:hypothetical protein